MVKKTHINIPKKEKKNQAFKSAAMMLTAPYLISQQYGTAISKTTIQTINDRLNRTFNKLSLQPIFLHLCSLSIYTIIRTFRFNLL